MSDRTHTKHLFIPGPAGVTDEVMAAFAQPIEPHYGDEFVAAYNRCAAALQDVFQTRNPVYLLVGPGTGALDAALGSALGPDAQVLVVSNGWFANRLGDMCEHNGARVELLEFPPGTPLDPEAVEEKLARSSGFEAVCWVHHETSTGALNPVEPIAAAARRHGALSIIDAVASIGGAQMKVDDWGVDLVVTVSNKCLAAPPGIAPISVSDAAWKVIDANPPRRGWYLNLRTWRWYRDNWGDWHPYPTTVPTGVVHALNVSLEQIASEGLESRIARHAEAAYATRAGLRNLGFEMFVDPSCASPITTSVRSHPELPAAELLAYLRDAHGIYISGGIAELRGKIFRIGHMGTGIERCEVERLLGAVEEAMRLRGMKIEDGAAVEGIWADVKT